MKTTKPRVEILTFDGGPNRELVIALVARVLEGVRGHYRRRSLTYQPAHTVTGSYMPSGTLTIKVPVADVGGPKSLYSVTGVTATQTTASSTGTAIFNVIDSTPPYNVH